MDKVIYKNNNAFLIKLESGFSAIINPLVDNGIKILNNPQIDIYNKINNKRNIAEISKITGHHRKAVINLLEKLSPISIANTNGVFKEKQYQPNKKALTFWVHITDKCNLNCCYCYISTKKTKLSITFDTLEQLKTKILELVNHKKLDRVKLRLSGGEPFTQFDLWKNFITELIKDFSKTQCYLHVGCLTNMTILNYEIINFIKNNKIGIGISLDGIDEWHDKARPYLSGRGSFKHIKANIDRLIENDIGFNIMVVASDENIHGLLTLTKFLVSKNIPFRFSDVKSRNFNREKFLKVLHECYDYIENEIENGYRFSKLHKLCDLNFSTVSPSVCSMGKSGAAIYVNGDIYFCHTHFGEQKPIGNLFENDDLFTIINRGIKHIPKLNIECKSCKYKFVCAGGCPVFRNANNKSHECDVFKQIIPRVFKLIAKERLFQVINSLN